MRIPARILRTEARALAPERAPLTDTQRTRRAGILKIAQHLMATHGRSAITLTSLATALDISTSTLRRHFADLDALLGEILRNHLLAISSALGDIPADTPNRHAKCRAAYHAVTHTGYGALTDAHLLLTRDSHLLPEDERTPLQQTHQNLGAMLAPSCPEEALLLLDSPTLTLDRIEAVLAPLLPKPAPVIKPTLALAAPAPQMPLDEPQEKPAAWIFSAGIPLKARSPPRN